MDGFISLLCSKNLQKNFEAKKELTLLEMTEVVENFLPDLLAEIEENVYLYDLDEALSYAIEPWKEKYIENLKDLPGRLASYSYKELLK